MLRVQGVAEEVQVPVPPSQTGNLPSREKGGAGAGLGALRVLSVCWRRHSPLPPHPTTAQWGGAAASQTSEQAPPRAAAPEQGWKVN